MKVIWIIMICGTTWGGDFVCQPTKGAEFEDEKQCEIVAEKLEKTSRRLFVKNKRNQNHDQHNNNQCGG